MRGVTLIELLVVLVIVAVALSIVVPSLGNGYESWTLRTAGRQTAAFLRFASNAARRDGTDLVCYYSGHNLVLLREGKIFKQLEIPASITVRPEKPRGTAFLPTGQIIASDPFVLENERGRKVIVQFGPLPGQVTAKEEGR